MDTSIFDVDTPSTNQLTGPVIKAKSICARCPSRGQCFDYGWEGETREQSRNLIYGGTTPRERNAIAASGLDPTTAAAELFEIQRRQYLLDIQLERRTDAS